jgi:eukaryotic-like serine/threonine-protein kinase
MASDAEATNGAGESHGAWAAPGPGIPGPGSLLAGRYRLRTRLGHGGMGTVWLARDELARRDVAVKEPRAADTLNERERAVAYARMRREALAAARIDHPAVITIHEVVVEDGRPWVVMELVRGRSLADILYAEGPISPQRAARIALPVVGALAAAHAAGVLHRDVKPGNVLLADDGRVVLSDFGVALVEGERPITESGAIVGSPEYLAPERALWRPPVPESDLWSLGVLLFEAVQGWSPFLRRTTLATLQAIVSDFPQIPRMAGPLLPLIMHLLSKEPGDRPDARQVEQALRAVVGAGPAPAGTGRNGRANKHVPLRQRLGCRTVMAAGAALALALVALVLALAGRG